MPIVHPEYAILFARGISRSFFRTERGACPRPPSPTPGPTTRSPAATRLPTEDAPGPEQGLFVTLPAEQLTLSGFCQGGASDTMAPGPLLATVVHTVAGEDGSGLAGCSDDQLMGIISAARRQESRIAWTVMAAIAEFARRAGHRRGGGVRRR